MLKVLQDFVYSGVTIKAGSTFHNPGLEAFLVARGLAEVIPEPLEEEPRKVPEPEPAQPEKTAKKLRGRSKPK